MKWPTEPASLAEFLQLMAEAPLLFPSQASPPEYVYHAKDVRHDHSLSNNANKYFVRVRNADRPVTVSGKGLGVRS